MEDNFYYQIKYLPPYRGEDFIVISESDALSYKDLLERANEEAKCLDAKVVEINEVKPINNQSWQFIKRFYPQNI